jgi:hypothetical protein
VTGARLVPVCALLAVVVVPGCGRTGLDDAVALRPGDPGAQSSDAAGAAQPRGTASSSGSSSSGGAASSSGSSGGAGSSSGGPSSESDGGDLFRPDEPVADDAAPAREADGASAPACGPAHCAGCCSDDGACRSGQVTSACGNGGQPCMECEAERSCNERGVCL